MKNTQTLEKYPTNSLDVRSKRFSVTQRVLLPLAALASVGLANAQSTAPAEITTLTGNATGGVSGITGAVATIAGVVLTIGLIVWGVRHLKPKG